MFLRRAEPADTLAVAQVHVQSWQHAYRGLISDSYLDSLRPEDRAAGYDFATTDPSKPRTIVAIEDGIIQGFATTMPSRDASLPEYGELVALYVHPDYWNRRFGYSLIQAARAHLVESGYSHALLWLLQGNIRGARFYDRDGWSHDQVSRTETVQGVSVTELRYTRSL